MSKTRAARGSVLILSILASGCSDLRVDKIREASVQAPAVRFDSPPDSNKIRYNLPRTKIVLQATLTLNDCDNVVAEQSIDMSQDLYPKTPPVDITELVTVAALNEPDPNQEYSIDIDKTRSWTKQLNLTVARNPNLTLVSFNGTLTDQAGPTIVAAIGTAIAIGGAVAMPAVAPVELGLATAAETKNSIQKSKLSSQAKFEASQQIALLSPNDLVNVEKLFGSVHTTQADKKIVPKIRDEAHANTQKRRVVVHVGTRPPTTTYCTPEIHEALQEIAYYQKIVNDAAKKKPTGSSPGATTKSDAASATPAVSSDVVKAQAQITRIMKQSGLTRTFQYVWIPSRDDLAGQFASDTLPIVLHHAYNFYKGQMIGPWFSSTGAEQLETDATMNPALKQLIRPVMLQLSVQPWTVGRDHGDAALTANERADEPSKRPDGVIYRDAAVGALRLCQDSCSPVTQIKQADITLTDQTADLANLQVPLFQLGRVSSLSMRSRLFETSVANLTFNSDGSTSVGTQSSSAAAAGFGGLSQAATSASAAITARNSAITANNTALVAQAQMGDVQNKAQADCLQQQQSIIAMGGRPVAPCQ